MMSTLVASKAMLLRDLRRSIRRSQDLAQSLIFFVIVITLLALAIGPDDQIFTTIAPAGVWIAILLATTINLERMFLSDYQDGTIELLLLSSASLPALVAAKIGAHWLTNACPQILMAVIVGAVLGLKTDVLVALGLSLLLGSPILSLIGGVASALTVGLRGGALLLSLIILPLYMPTLIFGTAAITNAALGLPIEAELFFLSGVAVLSASLAPFGAAAALRIRLS